MSAQNTDTPQRRAQSTAKDRHQARRTEKLAEIAEQVADGRLTVRKLTPAELEAHAPRRTPAR